MSDLADNANVAMKLLLNGRTPLEIVYGDGWVCADDPELAEVLNGLFPIVPSPLPYGAREVDQAQRHFAKAGGQLEIVESFADPDEEELPEGAVH